jgi:phosphoribosylanthranilate isomerase
VSRQGARLFVKICGVRSLEDALAVARLGADAIGFNFWPPSKRYIDVETARGIASQLPPTVRRFGVFVNQPQGEVMRALATNVIEVAQLHGDETPDYCQAFGGRYVKAVRLRDGESLKTLDAYDCDLTLVDSDTPGYGGSGTRADLSLATLAAARRKVLLAGGLTPENVSAAVAAVHPFGVDVAGGVESSPGVKDHAKIAAFIRAARI